MKNSIEVINLSKSYKSKQAVNSINFKINENEIVGLLGPNGSGKTTTIGMILGLLKPTSGKVLINDPTILLLDEPTASLDPETGDFIRTFLENYKKEKKIAVLLASHNMDEVKRLCSSVLMMKDGDIVDRGTPDDLIKKHGRKNLEEVFLELVRTKNEFN